MPLARFSRGTSISVNLDRSTRTNLTDLVLSGGGGVNPADIWKYQVTVAAGNTHTPVVTLYAGATSPLWDWGDGSPLQAGLSMSHTYVVAGTYVVTVKVANINWFMQTIDISTDYVSGNFLRTLAPMYRLTSILAASNILINDNIATIVWPTGLTVLGLDGSGITGVITSIAWPTSLTYLTLGTTAVTGVITAIVWPTGLTTLALNNTALTGVISAIVWPTGLTILNLYSTGLTGTWAGQTLGAALQTFRISSTVFTGAPVFTSAVALSNFQYQDCALDAATVDLILQRMWTRRMAFTAVAPTANLGGTNTKPNGIFQEMNPPTTGMEYKWALGVDDLAEGYVLWAITTTV